MLPSDDLTMLPSLSFVDTSFDESTLLDAGIAVMYAGIGAIRRQMSKMTVGTRIAARGGERNGRLLME